MIISLSHKLSNIAGKPNCLQHDTRWWTFAYMHSPGKISSHQTRNEL